MSKAGGRDLVGIGRLGNSSRMLPAHITPTTQTEGRLHALDAVRGIALLLGVLYHASLSFMPLMKSWWVIADSQAAGPVVPITYFFLHMFRMTLIFLITGFFARLVLERRGALGFVRDRLRRVALPLIIAWPICFAAIEYIIGRELAPAWLHLWFLYLLLVFYAFVLILRAISPKGLMGAADRVFHAIVSSRLAAPVFALPIFLVLCARTDWATWHGIPSPMTTLLPEAPSFTAYSVAFIVGWLLHRQLPLLDVIKRQWPLHAAVAIGALLYCLSFYGQPMPRGVTLSQVAAYTVGGWSFALAFTGMALCFCAGHSRVRRYMADASYWVYLLHVPVVLVLQSAFAPLPWPAELKYLLICVVAFALLLSTYQVLVRHTVVGRILDGKR